MRVSSRPHRSFVSYSRFTVLQLQPFTKQQSLELIDKLVFRPEIKDEFREQLDDHLYRDHMDFANNPLLLTIMLMTFDRCHDVPKKMHIFYREAFVTLAKDHDASKPYARPLKTGLSIDRFEMYFAEFCSRSYHDEKFEFTEGEIAAYYDSLLERKKDTNVTATAEDFIYDAQSNLCLMFYEGGKYFFSHRSFQEYFCAFYFSKQLDKNLGMIGDFFENRRSRNYGDKTFNMLYDMISPNVEEYIFCPFLNAYRRVDKGTKCLFAPNDMARQYAAEFRRGTREYLDDTKWWKAAQEEDQKQQSGGTRTTEVNTGDAPSDDLTSYLGGDDTTTPVNDGGTAFPFSEPSGASTGYTHTPTVPPTPAVPETSKLDELIQKSSPVAQMSGKNYKFGNAGALNVRVYELTRGEIKENGERKPCFFHSDGIDCDFVYDPNHPLLAQYPVSSQMLLLIYLSEKLKARDSLKDIMTVYASLVESTMQDSKVDRQSLQDRASSVFDLLRDKLTTALADIPEEVVCCIHESAGDVEETVTNLIQSNPALLQGFQAKTEAGYDAIGYVPPKALYRLVDKFPEKVMDGKVFAAPYMTISLPDPNTTTRARDESKDRILSFIKDALRMVVGYSQRIQKNELQRASLSVDFLLKELNS